MRSRRYWPIWGSISAWRSRTGRPRTLKSWPSASTSRIKNEPVPGPSRWMGLAAHVGFWDSIERLKRINDASQKGRPRLQPHLVSPSGDVRKPRRRVAETRADPHDAAQGEGSAPDRRAADHAGEARRAACPPPGNFPPWRPRPFRKIADDARSALCRPRWRLHPHHQGRVPLWRQRADGGHRARRPRSRRQGQGFRPGRRRYRRRGSRRLEPGVSPPGLPDREDLDVLTPPAIRDDIVSDDKPARSGAIAQCRYRGAPIRVGTRVPWLPQSAGPLTGYTLREKPRLRRSPLLQAAKRRRGLSFLAGGFSSGDPLSEPVQHLFERNAFAAVELRNAFSVLFDLPAFAVVEVLP